MPTVTKFIPQVWSAKILDALDKELVYSKLFNTDYEGEIQNYGDTVHIGSVGNVSISDYSPATGGELEAPEDVICYEETLTIDQMKAFNIKVDDVYKVQRTANLLEAATTRAGYAFADTCDKYLAGLVAKSANKVVGTDDAPEAVTADNAYEILVKLKTALDKQNCPKQSRVAVVPPEFEGFMLLDPRFVKATDKGDEATAEGTIYRAAGFEVAVSNNVPMTSDEKGYKVVAGSPVQGTFAQQILKTEAYRPENSFSDAVKGLHVYGAAVLESNALAGAIVSF